MKQQESTDVVQLEQMDAVQWEQTETTEKEYLDIIQQAAENMRKLNLMSDTFVSVALEDIAACQYVVRMLLGRDDIQITSVKGQYRLLNLTAKDSILDAFAIDSTGRRINLEVQRKTTVDHARRTRYYSSMIDKSILDKGIEYAELPDVYVIYISETDLWHVGEPICEVEKTVGKNHIPYDDGKHVVFVNAAVDDGSEVAQLMQYFKTADPDDMSQGDLSKRVHYLKREERGYEEMCEVAERIYNQGIEQGIERGMERGIEHGTERKAKQMTIQLHKDNVPDEIIAKAADVSVETVRAWIRQENA